MKHSFLEVCPYGTADPFQYSAASIMSSVWCPAARFPMGGATSGEKSSYILVLFACTYALFTSSVLTYIDLGRRRPEGKQESPFWRHLLPSQWFQRSSLAPESAACRLYVRKQTPCCQIACLSTKLPYTHEVRQKSASLKKPNLFHKPSWKSMGSSTTECHPLSLFAWQVPWVGRVICNIW